MPPPAPPPHTPMKTVFYKRAQRVNKILFLKRENDVHLFFICARLELFCDFLQSDWLQERAAFCNILAGGPKEFFSNNFFVYKGVSIFFKQLNDNVKVKMFSDKCSTSHKNLPSGK